MPTPLALFSRRYSPRCAASYYMHLSLLFLPVHRLLVLPAKRAVPLCLRLHARWAHRTFLARLIEAQPQACAAVPKRLMLSSLMRSKPIKQHRVSQVQDAVPTRQGSELSQTIGVKSGDCCSQPCVDQSCRGRFASSCCRYDRRYAWSRPLPSFCGRGLRVPAAASLPSPPPPAGRRGLRWVRGRSMGGASLLNSSSSTYRRHTRSLHSHARHTNMVSQTSRDCTVLCCKVKHGASVTEQHKIVQNPVHSMHRTHTQHAKHAQHSTDACPAHLYSSGKRS